MEMETQIQRLKSRLAKINTVDLLGYIGSRLIPIGNDGESIANSADIFSKTNLPSPLRQYVYLAGLLLSTEYDPTRQLRLDEALFCDLERKINEITEHYHEMHMEPFAIGNPSPAASRKSLISFAAFNSYFETGKLNYAEQTVNKIRTIFSQFDEAKEKPLPLTAGDFIGIYEAICDLDERSINDVQHNIDCLRSKLEEYSSELELNGAEEVIDDGQLLKNIGEKLGVDEQFALCIKNAHVVKRGDLVHRFGEEKTDIFLSLFSTKRQTSDFMYYGQKSPFLDKPLVEIEDGCFFVTFQPLIIEAVYEYINNLVSQNTKLGKKKSDAVETMTFNYFKSIFGHSAQYFRQVCEKPRTDEHDILILYEKYIFIIEVKGSKVRMPLFDPDKNSVRVENHFFGEAGIGYAYKQAIKLKGAIESHPSVTLYHDYEKPFTVTAVGKKVIPIVITLESFGQIEINTSILITPEKSQPYPWACCVDDLENLIKINKYLHKGPDEFVRYLKFREKYHEKIYATDELEILECFYNNVFKMHEHDVYILKPTGKSLIDKIHFEELGVPYEYEFGITLETLNSGSN